MDLEQVSFHIISYAGDSFSQMREALSEAKTGNFEKAEELMTNAKNGRSTIGAIVETV